MSEFNGADECDFLELLVANERILEWADELQTPGLHAARKKEIVFELRELVQSKSTYAEEATRAGIMPVITRLLSNTRDEDVMDAISQIMVACSGPLACGGKVSDYTYGQHTLRIREGALGDGLGAKVWTVAHILCREMIAHPEVVQGHDVLEIGAGCGVCGILAAKQGAQQVTLTDVEGPVLQNLRQCMHLNSNSEQSSRSQQQQSGAKTSRGDDADVCQDWDADNMQIRTMDWLESLRLMKLKETGGAAITPAPGSCAVCSVATDGNASTAGATDGNTFPRTDSNLSQLSTCTCGADELDSKKFYANDLLRSTPEPEDLTEALPPSVPLDKCYPRIIGTDIMYEPMHAQLVAAVLAHRLAPGGCALMCCAVRQARTFSTFTAECAKRGLRYRSKQIHPSKDYDGIIGRMEDYEGGFLLMAVDHVDSPCDSWHRSDWE